MNRKTKYALLSLLLTLCILLAGCFPSPAAKHTAPFSLSAVPAYSGSPYVAINDNVPYFSEDDYTTQSYESYSELDRLGSLPPSQRQGAAQTAAAQLSMPGLGDYSEALNEYIKRRLEEDGLQTDRLSAKEVERFLQYL